MMRCPLHLVVYRRTLHGSYGDACNGHMVIPTRGLTIVFSNGEGWEHVSVSRRDRCPTWDEMCVVKSLFWSDDECVMQLHPAKADYINQHSYCLHLWRPKLAEIPMPPKVAV